MLRNKTILQSFIVFLFLLGFNASQTNAQEFIRSASQYQFVQKNLLKLNILSPGISYERGLSPNITINGGLSLRTPIGLTSGTDANGQDAQIIYFGTSLDASIQSRYYYNIQKRYANNLNTQYNSANYLGFHIKQTLYRWPLTHKGITSENIGTRLGAVWGLQRSFNHFYINPEFGLNAHFIMEDGNLMITPLPVINFKMGFMLWGN